MRNAAFFLSFFMLSLSCSVKGPFGASGRVHISLAGNAWVLDDPLASSALIGETGLADWSDPAHCIGVFFHLAGTGKLQLSIRVRFTADATARKGNRLDYAGGLQDGAFFLRNCGFFPERTEIDTELERPPTGKRPEVDLEALPGGI